MEEMNISSAKYTKDIISNEVFGIIAVIDGVTVTVPLDEGNRHYKEIKRQVDAGTLKIEAVD